MSIHVISIAEMSVLVKIQQAQTKLPETAAIEMTLLSSFDRRVNNVIAPAAINGRSKAHQGSGVLIVKFIYLAHETRKKTRKFQRLTSVDSCFLVTRRSL